MAAETPSCCQSRETPTAVCPRLALGRIAAVPVWAHALPGMVTTGKITGFAFGERGVLKTGLTSLLLLSSDRKLSFAGRSLLQTPSHGGSQKLFYLARVD